MERIELRHGTKAGPVIAGHIRAVQRTVVAVKVTRQGVRDLNGPRMNGTGYNGRRSLSCPHFRDPQSVPIFTKPVLEADPYGNPRTVRRNYCASCNTDLGIEE